MDLHEFFQHQIVCAFRLAFWLHYILHRLITLSAFVFRQKKNRILVTANKNNNQSNTTAINNINNSSIDNSTERVSYEIFPKGSTHSDDHIDTQHKIAKSNDGAISQDVDNALLENETIPDSKTKTKKMFIELSLLKEPPFIIYCISIMLYTASFKSGFIFIPALVKSSGISESDAALIVSIIGVFDFTGRIVTGFIFDFQRVKQHRTVIYSGIVFVIAILSFLCPLVSSFKGFACLGSVYGLLTGAYISQKSVIVVDILGVEKLTSSFGILICLQGFGSLLGPPLSGKQFGFKAGFTLSHLNGEFLTRFVLILYPPHVLDGYIKGHDGFTAIVVLSFK